MARPRRDAAEELTGAEQLLDLWHEVDPYISGPSSEYAVTYEEKEEHEYIPDPAPVVMKRIVNGTVFRTGTRPMTDAERETYYRTFKEAATAATWGGDAK